MKKHGKPKSPSDLDQHACLIFVQRGAPRAWGFKGRLGNIAYQSKGPFRTNDAEQIRTDVLADLGLAQTPGWLFAGEIASGAVHRVLRAHKPAALSFSAVHPGGRRLASKVQASIDFLAKAFADEPVLAIDQSV